MSKMNGIFVVGAILMAICYSPTRAQQIVICPQLISDLTQRLPPVISQNNLNSAQSNIQQAVTNRNTYAKRLALVDCDQTDQAARAIASLGGASGQTLNDMYARNQRRRLRVNNDIDSIFFNYNVRATQTVNDRVRTNPNIGPLLTQFQQDCTLTQAQFDAYLAQVFQDNNQNITDAAVPLATTQRIQAQCFQTGLQYLNAGYYDNALLLISQVIFNNLYPTTVRLRLALRYAANARYYRCVYSDSLTRNQDIATINTIANSYNTGLNSAADVQAALASLQAGAATSMQDIRTQSPNGVAILTFLNSYCPDADALLGTLQNTYLDNFRTALDAINAVGQTTA